MSEPAENFQPPPPPPSSSAGPPAPRPTAQRPVAIGLFVVGLLICVGGIAKLIPGGIGTGLALVALGLALFALSFVPLPVVGEEEGPLSPVQKLIGIFFEPSRVFRNLRAYPRWLAAYLVVVVLSAIYTFAFTQRVTPERIVNHTMDKLAEIGPPLAPPPDRLEQMRAKQIEDAKNPIQRVGAVIRTFVGAFFLVGIMAALYMLATLVFGGRINYWQVFAALFYAAVPVVAVQKILGLVLLYVKSPEDIHPILGQETLVQDNLGVLVSPANHPVIFVLASAIGVLSFYTLWLKATGVRNSGTKVSKKAAWSVAVTMWLLGLLLITGITALFPNFIS
jgi:hypothetical protein